MRLLLAEDDKDLSGFVRESLQREGFVVDWAKNGQEALTLFQERPYDVVLLDVMMPNLDGISVMKNLRKLGYSGAILLMTSRGHEIDKLDGFNSGADDYLVKPFLMSELTARVRAILRRTHPAKGELQSNVLTAGDIEMNLVRREVYRAGKLIPLTKREFDLLECFLRRPGHVLSQSVLAQQVSQTDYATTTNTIEVHMKNLRTKIDRPKGPSIIRTVRGCGYALEIK